MSENNQEFTNFQKMFRNADSHAGIRYEIKYKIGDTSDFDQMASDPGGVNYFDASYPWWNKLKYSENEVIISRKCVARVFVPSLNNSVKKVRKLRIHPFRNRFDKDYQKESWEDLIIFDNNWEEDICWRDEIDSEDNDAKSQNDNKKFLDDKNIDKYDLIHPSDDISIKVPLNYDIMAGSWVKHIVWDDQLLDVYEDDYQNGIFEYEIPLVLPDADAWLELETNSKIDSSVIQYQDKEPTHDSSMAEFASTTENKVITISPGKLFGEAVASSTTMAPNIEVKRSLEQLELSNSIDISQSKIEKLIRAEKEKAERIKNVRGIGIDNSLSNIMLSVSTAKRPREEETQNKRRRFIIPTADHGLIATKHRNTRSDLFVKELRYFHRPRLHKKFLLQTWAISSYSSSESTTAIGENTSQPLSTPTSLTTTTTINRMRSKGGGGSLSSLSQMIDREDFSLVEGDFICIEYIEKRPPIVSNLGMASRILNYYRLPTDPSADTAVGEEKYSSSSSSSSINGTNDSTRINEPLSKKRFTHRLPRHLQYLLDDRRKYTGNSADQDIDIPRLLDGQTIPLEADEESPFLGEIAPGSIQSCMANNMFIAPIFNHTVSRTDFMLIQLPRSKGAHTLSFLIKEIPRLFVCGQQEPQRIIPRPSKKMTKQQEEIVMLQIARYFENIGMTKVNMDSILDIFHTKKFKRNEVQRLVKTIAECDDDGRWYRKPELTQIPVQYYESKISPEDVCIQESCNAAELWLRDIGIDEAIDTLKVEMWLERMLKRRDYAKRRATRIKEASKRYLNSERGAHLSQLADYLSKDVQRLQRRLDIGREIYEKLLMAPWSTTEAFVKCYVERGAAGGGGAAAGLLDLTGPGDPSGIGEGYSFVRRSKGNLGKRQFGRNPLDNVPQGPSISNTNRDLRKITTKEADRMLIGMGMDSMDVKSLKRWDRIALIREMASRAERSGTAESLHRFARERKQSVTMRSASEEFKAVCQQIWERQLTALSGAAVPEDEDGGIDDLKDDDDDSLDELEGALERDLELRTSEESNGSKKSVEDEDKKELLELQSELSEEAVHRKRHDHVKLSISGREDGRVTGASDSSSMDVDTTSGTDIPTVAPRVYPPQIVKRVTRRVSASGEETIETRYIVMQSEIERVRYQEKQQQHRPAMYTKKVSNNDGSDEEREGRKPILNLHLLRLKAEHHRDKAKEVEEEYEEPTKPTTSHHNERRLGLGMAKRNLRLPLMRLAVQLESILMDLWRKNIAVLFRYPVDMNTYTDYLTLVTRPISLSDIRNNLAKGHYVNAKSFLSDLELMAANAGAYNGTESSVARDAQLLVGIARKLIKTDETAFELLEKDIRAKFMTINRSLKIDKELAMVPDLMIQPRITTTSAKVMNSFSTSNNSSSSTGGIGTSGLKNSLNTGNTKRQNSSGNSGNVSGSNKSKSTNKSTNFLVDESPLQQELESELIAAVLPERNNRLEIDNNNNEAAVTSMLMDVEDTGGAGVGVVVGDEDGTDFQMCDFTGDFDFDIGLEEGEGEELDLNQETVDGMEGEEEGDVDLYDEFDMQLLTAQENMDAIITSNNTTDTSNDNATAATTIEVKTELLQGVKEGSGSKRSRENDGSLVPLDDEVHLDSDSGGGESSGEEEVLEEG